MTKPRVTILYNEPTLPADHPDADAEHDVLETADLITKHLQAAGLAVSRLGVTADPQALINGLKQTRPDCVFNLYEGTAGWGNSEEYVAGILELLKIPYTGCPTLPMTLCRNKPLSKRLFEGAGIPTAPYFIVEDGPCPPCSIPWPVIVKPGEQDASVGIDQSSVCTTQAQLEVRVEYLRKTYGPSILVEQMIVGREFHVPVIEMDGKRHVLPFSEILFPPPPDGEPIWPIVTFDAKWKPQSRDFAATPAQNPAVVDEPLRLSVTRIVIRAFELLECRDYARVDLRVDTSGKPYVLEMNPNPCINPLAGVAAALESAKIPYPSFLLSCVRNALRRGSKPELADFEAIPTKPISSVVIPNSWACEELTCDLSLTMEQFTAGAAFSQKERANLLQRISHIGESTISIQTNADGKPVGVAGAQCLDAENRVYGLNILAVHANHRRSGVGAALLSAIEKKVISAGGRILVVELSSSPGFGVARQFLGSRGYHSSGDVPDFFHDGCSRMTFSKTFPAVISLPNSGPTPSRFAGSGGGLL